jgi:tRNA(His) 5'-end guanylyltransferase
LRGLSASARHELLFWEGIHFDDLPSWQKRGTRLYWEEYDRPGANPVTGEPTTAHRRRIRRDLEWPMRDAYSAFLLSLMRSSGGVCGRAAEDSGA